MNIVNTEKKLHFLECLLESRLKATLPVIAEIKLYTPKNGDLLKDRTVEYVASCYERSGMACLSVVTGHWFKGSLPLLKQVSAVTRLPILRKDFIVTRSGLELSKTLGASAVLLTKQLIDSRVLNKLADYALTLGMTPFIEVGTAEEISELRVDQEMILAVCNRDIKTRETDEGGIDKSLMLLAAAKSSGAGLVVSASAIENSSQAKLLLDAGYDGLLIGTAFLQATDLTVELEKFRDGLKTESVTFFSAGK